MTVAEMYLRTDNERILILELNKVLYSVLLRYFTAIFLLEVFIFEAFILALFQV